jgi:hypothetical protein
VYPMNMSWLNGKLTAREMEEEHPLELERILESPSGKSTLDGKTTKGDPQA